MKKQEKYWLWRLSGELPILDLPSDKLRSAMPSYKGSSEKMTLGNNVCQALQKISAESGTTLFMTLLAILKVWLSKMTGQEDIIVGTPISGRTHPDVENVIGMFMNTVVLRTKVIREEPFKKVLSAVKQTVLEGLSNQDYPLSYNV